MAAASSNFQRNRTSHRIKKEALKVHNRAWVLQSAGRQAMAIRQVFQHYVFHFHVFLTVFTKFYRQINSQKNGWQAGLEFSDIKAQDRTQGLCVVKKKCAFFVFKSKTTRTTVVIVGKSTILKLKIN